jgi:hypothetical protein
MRRRPRLRRVLKWAVLALNFVALVAVATLTVRLRAEFRGQITTPFIAGMILMWTSVVAALIATVVFWYRNQRIPPGHCQTCGYNLTGNTSGRCPECGQPVEGTSNQAQS